MSVPNNLPLALLAAYGRSLLHALRTPLAVISNELSYLKSVADSESGALAAAKCEQIRDLLKNFTPVQAVQGSSNSCLLTEVARVDGQLGASVLIASDPALLRQAFDLWERLRARLASDHRARTGDASGRQGWEVRPAESAGGMVELTADVPIKCSGAAGLFRSFTELFAEHLQLDFVEAPLLDALFFSQGASVSLEVLTAPEQRFLLLVKIQLPVARPE